MRMLAPHRRFALARRTVATCGRHARFVRALAFRRTALRIRPVAQVLRAIARMTSRMTRVIVPVVLRELRVEPAVTREMRTSEVTQRLHERTVLRERSLLARLVERRSHVEHRDRSHTVRRLVERTFAPANRAAAPARDTVIYRIERPGNFSRIAQTLLRTHPAAPTAREAGQSAPMSPRSAATFPRQPVTPHVQAIVLPPEELSRVSNFVIAEFDRRVLSYRERTGRA